MKKQNLEVTANNKAVMMWAVSIVQNDERQIFGVYTDIGEAYKAEKALRTQGFDVAFRETSLNFAD